MLKNQMEIEIEMKPGNAPSFIGIRVLEVNMGVDVEETRGNYLGFL